LIGVLIEFDRGLIGVLIGVKLRFCTHQEDCSILRVLLRVYSLLTGGLNPEKACRVVRVQAGSW
jgi:hypothetical protein